MQAELAVVVTDTTPLGLQAKFTAVKAGIETLHINLDAEKRRGKSYGWHGV
ncbi:hypothetical protein [uncultured Pontibacter sp.]|uniref:hypothetical protein n=1 Tax=uncultured Pontibacter sp. TaxID=453356 RepID=UPI002633FBC0|nr:hypothetical protein [uncultured Pontibacter sp.]